MIYIQTYIIMNNLLIINNFIIFLGSYALDEPKRSPTVNAYAKHPSREFYA